MKHSLWIVISCVFLLGIALWPSDYRRVLSVGTDSHATHYQIWGTRSKKLSVISPSEIRGLGLIVANMRHADSVAPIHVVVSSPKVPEPIVRDFYFPELPDDSFVWMDFSERIARAGEEIVLEVSAPQADTAHVLGIRFDGDTKQPAFGTIERVPLWKYGALWSKDNPDMARTLFTTVVGGFILACIAGSIEYIPKRFQKKYFIILLILLACGTIVLRAPLARSIDSAYGGDAFNYLLKSRALIEGRDPFTADPRKAPLYSFMVAPGLAMPFDAVTWERWVSIFSAIGIVVLVPLLLRQFAVPLSLSLLAGALIGVNRDLQFESVQGLSNTLYAFLVLATAYVFLLGKGYAVAVFGGLATLARYEGGAVVVLLLPLSWVIEKMKWRGILRTLIPLAVLFLIPLSLFPLTHEFGVRTVSDIQGDEGLYLAHSLDDFWSNFKGFKHLFGRLWIQTPNIGNPFHGFWVGVIAGGLLLVLRRFIPTIVSKYSQKIWACVPYLVIILFVWIILRGPSEYLVYFFSCGAGIGAITLLAIRPKHTSAIILAIAVQIISITLILPKDRYYLHVIPFIAIACVAGIYALSNAKASRIGLAGALLCVGMMSAFAYEDASRALSGQVSDYNEKSAGQTVLLNSARYLKGFPGIVAVAEGSDLQLRSYLPTARVAILPDSVRDVDAQLSLLEQHDARYIVDTKENPYFAKLVQAYPERFKAMETFKTKWSDVLATVYRVVRP